MCTPHVCRLTEEEESAPSGPPRTKNELLFDNSLIYDPDSTEIENIELHSGQSNDDSCQIGSSSKQRIAANSVSINDLNQIGTIMYDATFLISIWPRRCYLYVVLELLL